MTSPRAIAADLIRLLDAAAEPIYLVDEDGAIAFCNQACGDLLGVPAAELVGSECQFHSEPSPDAARQLAASLCPPPEAFVGQTISGEVHCPTPSGDVATYLAEFVPLDGSQQRCIGVMVFLHTKRQNAVSNGQPHLRSDHGGATAAAAQDEAGQLHAQLAKLHRQRRQRYHVDSLLGQTPAIARARAQVKLAASSRSNVLIIGPAGSGREHVARAIHYGQARETDAAIIPLTCSVLKTELFTSALAAWSNRGSFRASSEDTLLLNHVDQLSSQAQAELMRFLDHPPGNPRLISTAATPLAALVDAKTFRADLACALSTLAIELPPLVDRIEDLPIVAQAFLEAINARSMKQLRGFSSETLDLLALYSWPDNFDELAEVVQSAHAHATASEITITDLPRQIMHYRDAVRHPRRAEETIDLEQFLAQVETQLIGRAISRARGNKSKAARLLGMTRPRLYRRMVQLGLEQPKETPHFEPDDSPINEDPGEQ